MPLTVVPALFVCNISLTASANTGMMIPPLVQTEAIRQSCCEAINSSQILELILIHYAWQTTSSISAACDAVLAVG